MHKTKVTIDLDVPENEILTEAWRHSEPERLAKMMIPELQNFEDWFLAQGQNPLIGVERAILKTYIAWKIRS